MRVTRFTLDGDTVRPDVADDPTWEPFDEWDGQPLRGVQQAGVDQTARAEVQLVHIAAGGHFVMHASPDLAFCQVVRGKGLLRLPDGSELPYEGPELYVFHPDTLHEWDAIEQDTLLSNCLVRAPEQP